MAGKAETVFRSKAPWIMMLLRRDFPALDVDDAAAIVGNLGHESGGFTSMQEIRPTVAGSRGGYGWAQWTGPRRRAFEAWCKQEGLSPADDEANYRYLVVELRGPEKKAIGKLAAAKSLADKVKAFELAFERAGANTKHYASRNRWAAIALDELSQLDLVTLPAWAVERHESTDVDPSRPPAPAPVPSPAPRPERVRSSKRFWTWFLTLVGALVTALKDFGFVELDYRVQLAILAAIVGFAVYAIAAMPAVRRALGLAR